MNKIAILLLLFTTILFAKVGNVTLIEGEAFVKRDNQTIKLNLNDEIKNKDFIETKTNSKVRITFVDDTVVTIGKESTLNIDDYIFNSSDSKSEFSVTKGAFHTITGQIGKVNPNKFKLKTKNATLGIRGTEIYGNQDKIFCTEGEIYVESFGEIREVKKDFFVFTYSDKIPSLAQPIDPREFENVEIELTVSEFTKLIEDFDDTSKFVSLDGSSSNQEIVDTSNTWGYWEVQNEANNNQNDFVTDRLTPTDVTYFQSQLNQGSILTFNGSANFSGVTLITNSVNAELEFGSSGNYLTFYYNFNDGANINLNSQVSGTITSPSFTVSDDIEFSGQFYGPTINTILGTVYHGPTNLKGTFSASR